MLLKYISVVYNDTRNTVIHCFMFFFLKINLIFSIYHYKGNGDLCEEDLKDTLLSVISNGTRLRDDWKRIHG